MANINTLQTLLNQKINAGRYKMSAYIEDENEDATDGIFLFYTGLNETYKLGLFVQQGYFNSECQIACRHHNYNEARSMAFKAIKYISVHRNDTSNVHFIPGAPPRFTGQDERTSGYWWVFEIQIKGGDS